MTEEAPQWRVSSYSGGAGGTCVEVAEVAAGVLVRNSNQVEAGTLLFGSADLAAFVAGCKAGEFDDLA